MLSLLGGLDWCPFNKGLKSSVRIRGRRSVITSTQHLGQEELHKSLGLLEHPEGSVPGLLDDQQDQDLDLHSTEQPTVDFSKISKQSTCDTAATPIHAANCAVPRGRVLCFAIILLPRSRTKQFSGLSCFVLAVEKVCAPISLAGTPCVAKNPNCGSEACSR